MMQMLQVSKMILLGFTDPYADIGQADYATVIALLGAFADAALADITMIE